VTQNDEQRLSHKETMMNTQQTLGAHAVVIGGSIAGLMTARVLSDHFAQVTILERDPVGEAPQARKGQPQVRHLHALLAGGLDVMNAYFPGFEQTLEAAGAQIGDGDYLRWYGYGGYRVAGATGVQGVFASRPLIEWCVRQRVLALSNVTLRTEIGVEALQMTADNACVTGVQIVHRREENRREVLPADLVVDASGRGSATPKWLTELGYAAPPESTIKAGIGYATRLYARQPSSGPVTGYYITPDAPDGLRGGGAFPIEGDRWIVTLTGYFGDHAPSDDAGFLEYAATLPAPDIHDLIRSAAPLTEVMVHKYPSSLRRHYEQVKHFPARLLVLGDAMCSFNPIFGQGMTVASQEAAALDALLQERRSLDGLWKPFFRAAAKIVTVAWDLTAGEDFRYPAAEGKRPAGLALLNAYVGKMHRATHHDMNVYRAFLRVAHLQAPPTTLMHPKIMWRVFRGAGKSAPAPTIIASGTPSAAKSPVREAA